jgi:hypothetical protein
MSLLKKAIKILSGFFFSLSLSLLILIFLAYMVTSYENGKTIFTTVFMNMLKKQINPQQLEQTYNQISTYCKERESLTLPLMNENITLNCTSVLNTNSTHLLYLLAEKSFDKFYHKNYGCEFIECVQKIKSAEDATVFFSSLSHTFFKEALMPMILLTILTGITLFFSIESWPERCKTFGLEFFFIGIFFLLIPYVKSFTLGQLPLEVAIVENIFDKVFELISPILLIFLIVGIILLGMWSLSKFLVKKKIK